MTPSWGPPMPGRYVGIKAQSKSTSAPLKRHPIPEFPISCTLISISEYASKGTQPATPNFKKSCQQLLGLTFYYD